MKQVAELQDKILDIWEKEGNKELIPLSKEQELEYLNASTCHICSERITYQVKILSTLFFTYFFLMLQGSITDWTKQGEKIKSYFKNRDESGKFSRVENDEDVDEVNYGPPFFHLSTDKKGVLLI